MQRAARPVGLISRLLAVVMMLIGAGVAQQKPAPRVSELVARQSFVLMQFITAHGQDSAYDDHIDGQIDQMRTFNKGKADQDMVDLLESYALVRSQLGAIDDSRMLDLEASLEMITRAGVCHSAVRASIEDRFVAPDSVKACGDVIKTFTHVLQVIKEHRHK